MRQVDVYLRRYGWQVTVLMDVTCDDALDVAAILVAIGADRGFITRAQDETMNCPGNVGIAYSNPETRETVIAIGRSQDAGEVLNTACHENMHAAMHIAEAFGLDPFGEAPCYIGGTLMQREAETLLNLV